MEQQQDLPAALVVEDDLHIGQLLQFMLARSGYRVTLVTDGQAAHDHILSQPAPTVMLLDVMLPHVDGLQLVALLRRQPGWEKVPVLMLTAKARDNDVARAMEAGATDYLAKPFQPEELLARLRAFTAR